MQLKMDNKGKKVIAKEIATAFDREYKFINGLFSSLSLPVRVLEDNDSDSDEHVYVNEPQSKPEAKEIKRAQNIQELHNRLEKLKRDNPYSVRNKLSKKSITTKLTKKAKKEERKKKMKLLKVKTRNPEGFTPKFEKTSEEEPRVPTQAKPVFNSQGKMVFSKFDFSDSGSKTAKKGEKDPRKILENLKKQEETVKQLKEAGQEEKATELKEKIAWQNVLAKAEGQKVKDDPLLLKKSMKKQEQIKKQSKKKWEARTEGVEKSLQERQKKRSANIQKKKTEKKANKVKKSAKRGRIVLP